MTDFLTSAIKLRILERIGIAVKNKAIQKCPVDNGRLRTSIEYKVNAEDDSVTIGTAVPYAAFVEFGTGVFHIDEEGKADPHTGWDVVPVNAQALRFEPGRKGRLAKGGKPQFVFAKKVHIEGAKPHPFLRPAVFNSTQDIQRIVVEELSR